MLTKDKSFYRTFVGLALALMMHQGHLELDLSGEERRGLKVEHLLERFNAISIECGN